MQHVIVPKPYPEIGAISALPVPPAAMHLRAMAVYHTRQLTITDTPDNRVRAMESVRRLASALGK